MTNGHTTITHKRYTENAKARNKLRTEDVAGNHSYNHQKGEKERVSYLPWKLCMIVRNPKRRLGGGDRDARPFTGEGCQLSKVEKPILLSFWKLRDGSRSRPRRADVES